MAVELRGPIKRNPISPQVKTTEDHQATPQEKKSIPSPQEETKQKSEWEWTGVWSFGSLRLSNATGTNQEIASSPSGTSSSIRKIASKRSISTHIPIPFHYKFVKEKDPLSVNIPSSAAATVEEEEEVEDMNDDKEETQTDKKDGSSNNKKETFGSGAYYKDANSVFPTICPKGGSWEGYFENLQTGPARNRDKKSTTRVEETFYLFFNCKPPPNAKTAFEDDDSGAIGITTAATLEKESVDAESSPSKVHVRGMGTNLFGTFEILGWLDISTKILHCQRSYLPVPKIASKRGHRNSFSGSHSTSRGGNKYFTRKKIMSWQRPTDSDEEKPQLLRGSGSKKRQRSASQSNLERNVSTTSVAAAAAASTPVEAATDVQESSAILDSATQLTKPNPAQVATTKAVSLTDPSSSPPKSTQSPTQTLSKKKHSVREKLQARSIHLPPVADSMEARWRSAHFIFYQRNTNPSDDTPSSAATTTTTCIYEGQFLNGYGMREGHGVCLYPNGNIYEGGFRRNKESGFGTLYSGDRKKIFYTGDWDRGKMHGRGKYYYYYTDSLSFLDSNSSSNTATTPSSTNNNLPPSLLRHAKKHQKNLDLHQILIGVYQGDFKENVRHGYGTYTLPDGTTYEGEFQNNVFHGKGTFTWPDGSIYTGAWKDGRRHGQGLLKSSDGFSYEGSWSNNAMEGRGTCVYPNDQRYEGLFVLGKKEGRGTIRFTNGAIYEGRFKDDCMEGQGTMKMSRNVAIGAEDWMIPIEFQSDMEHIHQKAGFDHAGS